MRPAIVVLPLLLAVAAPACRSRAPQPGRSPGIEHHPGVRDVHALAETYRAKHGLPALGIGIVHRGRIVGLGMAGERVAGSGHWATLDDAFDVASCSKSVSATIAAMLVEQGTVRWDTTVAEAFPEWQDRIHPGYAKATLEMLLQHRAGLDHRLNRNDRWADWHRTHRDASPSEQRLAFARTALAQAPLHPPGTKTAYTSDGYVVAGSLLERAAGVAWERLVTDRLLDPLRLQSFRYGPLPRHRIGQPVHGHEAGWFGAARPVAPDPTEYGSPPFGAPAGFLYASVPDLLRYVDFHIQGANSRGGLLTTASFARLHRAVDGELYGLGWESEVQHDGGGQVVEHSVHHGGYSGRFRANLWFVPETQWGTVIVMNHGRGDDAITADIFSALLREYRLVPASP